MSVDSITAYNLKLQRKSFDDLLRQQLKKQQDDQRSEALRLHNFQEMTRLQRNKMHYDNYWRMELYEFQRKTLTLQRDTMLNVGTNVDFYT